MSDQTKQLLWDGVIEVITAALVMASLLLAVACHSGGGSGGSASDIAAAPLPTLAPDDPAPDSSCGDGLAARDLEQNCRAESPTPGAIEAWPPKPKLETSNAA